MVCVNFVVVQTFFAYHSCMWPGCSRSGRCCLGLFIVYSKYVIVVVLVVVVVVLRSMVWFKRLVGRVPKPPRRPRAYLFPIVQICKIIMRIVLINIVPLFSPPGTQGLRPKHRGEECYPPLLPLFVTPHLRLSWNPVTILITHSLQSTSFASVLGDP